MAERPTFGRIPMRDEDAAVADRTNQGAEGLLVALVRSIHECPEHPLLLVVGAGVASSTSMSLRTGQMVRSSFRARFLVSPAAPTGRCRQVGR